MLLVVCALKNILCSEDKTSTRFPSNEISVSSKQGKKYKKYIGSLLYRQI